MEIRFTRRSSKQHHLRNRVRRNTIVNDDGDAIDLYCGDWIASHRAACAAYEKRNTIRISEKRDVVIVSCGGWPYDINMIQAHKALEAASHSMHRWRHDRLLAECSRRPRPQRFSNWFFSPDSSGTGETFVRELSGQWPDGVELLRKTERFKVEIVTELGESETTC
jgi:nickel-dependent lactate racemase